MAKTDRLDAALPARVAEAIRPAPAAAVPDAVRHLDGLLTRRNQLIAMRAVETDRLDRWTATGRRWPGQFRAVEIATGKRLRESWRPVTGKEESDAVSGGTAFVVKNGDRFFLCNDQGELVIARPTPEKYEELGRWKMLDVTGVAFGRKVVWSPPAFADKCVFARNDKEIVCVNLAK